MNWESTKEVLDEFIFPVFLSVFGVILLLKLGIYLMPAPGPSTKRICKHFAQDDYDRCVKFGNTGKLEPKEKSDG